MFNNSMYLFILEDEKLKSLKKLVFNLLLLLLAIFAFPLQSFGALENSNAPTGDNLGPITPQDTIYQIVTDRFYDGDLSNNIPEGFDSTLFDGTGEDLKLYQGGDFAGIKEQIPYLKNMGITAVWISAPYSNRDTEIIDYQSDGSIDRWTSFHGYHARNYFETNKHFGTMMEFMDMKNTLQDNGIKVVLDFVSNHTSRWQNPTDNNSPEDGRLYEPFKDANGNYMFDQFGEPIEIDGETEQLLADSNGSLNTDWFYLNGDRGGDDSRYGYRYKDLGSLASFNHENPDAIDHLYNGVEFWVNTGIDGIRHDATLHMNPAFVKGFKQHIDSLSSGPLTHFGEFFIGRPDPKYDEYSSFPDRTGVNNLDFEWYRASANTFGNFSESMSDFGEMMVKTSEDYTYENQTVTFLDNHDVTRFRYTQNNDKPYHAGLVALMTSRGTPNIYYGTEQYLSSDDASDIAGRVFMQRETDFDESTTAYQIIQKLSSLRQTNSAVAYGLTNIRYSDEHVLVFERSFYDNTVLVAINRHPDESFIVPQSYTNLPTGTYEDELDGLLYGTNLSVNNNYFQSFELEGGETAVWSYHSNNVTNARIGDVVSIMGIEGDTVNIYGTGLDGQVNVYFDNIVAPIHVQEDDFIQTEVPRGINPGEVEITLLKNGEQSNSFIYNVLSGVQSQVVFNVHAQTAFGENIHVVGNIPELGSWNPENAPEAFLNPEYPYWFLPVSVPINETIEFKFIKVDDQGNVQWESGENRVVSTPSNTNDVQVTEVYYYR